MMDEEYLFSIETTEGKDLTFRRTVAWLLLILLVGSLMRFIALDNQSLWNDELSSIHRSSYSTITEVINKGVLTEFHPPGYHLLLFAVEQLWGDSEIAVRIPSAVFGLLSIVTIFWIGMRFYSRRVGLIAAMLIAVSEFPVYYSQEARCYAALLLFSMISMGCWMEIRQRIERHDRLPWTWIVSFQISSLVSAYLHYFGLFLLALQAVFIVWMVVRHRCSIGIFSVLFVPIGAIWAPWLPYLLKQTSTGPIWIPVPTISYPFELLRFFFNRYGGLVIIVTVIYLIPVSRQFLGRGKWRDPAYHGEVSGSNDRVLLWWLFLPIGIVLIVSWLYKPMAIHRYFIISLPAAYLLAARAIERLPMHLKVKDLFVLILGLFLLVDLIVIKQYYTKPHKEQFREAAATVVRQEKEFPNSLIAACGHASEYFDYYFRHQNSSRHVDLVACEKKDIQKIQEQVGPEPGRYIWLLRGHRKFEDGFLEKLQSGFELTQHDSLVGADVWLLRNR